MFYLLEKLSYLNLSNSEKDAVIIAEQHFDKKCHRHLVKHLVRLKENNVSFSSLIRPDLVYKNKVIEFYGDYYHANPAMFNENNRLNPRQKTKTSKMIWDQDEKRIQLIKEHGFEVLVVWNKDYVGDKHGTVNKCVEFLNG